MHSMYLDSGQQVRNSQLSLAARSFGRKRKTSTLGSARAPAWVMQGTGQARMKSVRGRKCPRRKVEETVHTSLLMAKDWRMCQLRHPNHPTRQVPQQAQAAAGKTRKPRSEHPHKHFKTIERRDLRKLQASEQASGAAIQAPDRRVEIAFLRPRLRGRERHQPVLC